MTLADLAEALRRFRLLSIGLLVSIVGAGVAAAVLPAERYRTTAVVSVEPISQGVGFESQQAIQLTIPPTIARLVSADFERSVRLRMQPANRNKPISIAGVQDPGTAIIDVTVESTTPAAAVDAAAVALQRLVQEPRSDRFRVNVVSPPAAATSVKAQRAPPLLVGSLVLGLIVAILAAAALHALRPALPRADDFRKRYGHDVLGEIPEGKPRGGHGQTPLNGSASPEMREAFRTLEARLTRRSGQRGDGDSSRSIVVTSWSKIEGKSTVVANLACALAAYNRDVTVVDCDMRRPRLHTLLESSIEPGVSDVADGKAVRAVMQPTRLQSLQVVAAGLGGLSRHPAEIAQDAVPRLLSVLSDRIVLIDAPPLFTAETTAIVAQADFVLLVADHRKRRPEDMDAALAELQQIGTPLLGVVLNRVDVADSRGREAYLYQPAASSRRRRLKRRA
ncbi:MAG: CpsD/CapB family tyrosine-protein kinase [Actinomycetota bacterium]|nr:CpsD/CapB family tyrosine-protein kinase [Actinomycetota bacterium]